MNKSVINKLMQDSPTWKSPEFTHARAAFTIIMKRYDYGYDALIQAWTWFLSGYLVADV